MGKAYIYFYITSWHQLKNYFKLHMHLFDYNSFGTEVFRDNQDNYESYNGYTEVMQNGVIGYREISVFGGNDGKLKPSRYVKDFDKRRESKLCKYCSKPVWRIYEDSGKVPGYEKFENFAFQCFSCKWWKVIHQTWLQTWPVMGFELIFREARIQSFDVKSSEIPISLLNTHIEKKPELLYSIHPTKLETLVTSVFKNFYDCEAIHCGQSHDGGIDLILLDAEKPTMVQVKRRSNPNHVEPISSIREFLGAMMIKNAKYGKFVTTAKDFSRPAKKDIKKVLEYGTVEQFELINYDSLKRIINRSNSTRKEPWERAIRHPFDSEIKYTWRK